MNPQQLAEYGFYGGALLLAGAAEYFKIAPPGTFAPLLTLIVGHYLGSVPTKTAINTNTQAVQANTAATLQAADAITPPR